MRNQAVDVDTEETFLFNLLTGIACGLSFFGTLFVVTSYLRFPRLRTMAFEFVVMLVLSDLLSNLAWLIKPLWPKTPTVCTTQAFFLTYSALAEMMWCFYIWNTIRIVLIQPDPCAKKSKKYLEWLRCWAHLLCWSVPLCISLLPLAIGSYARSPNDQVWHVCWIEPTQYPIYNSFIMVFLILNVFLVLFISYVYCWTFELIQTLDVSSTEFFEAGDTTDYRLQPSYITKTRLKFYPTIRLLQVSVFWVFFFYPSRPFELVLVFSLVRNIEGFLHSVIYGCTEIVFYEWSRSMRWGRTDTDEEYKRFLYSEIVDRDELVRMQDNYYLNRIDEGNSIQRSNSESRKAPIEVIDC